MQLKREILFVSRNAEKYTEQLKVIFPEEGWKMFIAQTLSEAKSLFIENFMINAVICGYELSDGSGKEFLDYFRANDENSPLFLFDEDEDASFSAMDVKNYRALQFVIHNTDLLRNEAQLKETSAKVMNEYKKHMSELCMPKIESEYGQLRSVLVHTPSDEIERIDPSDLGWTLFESRPELDHMRLQHLNFLRQIKNHGKRPAILDVALLLFDVVDEASMIKRKELVEYILFNRETRVMARKFEHNDMVFSPVLNKLIEDICSKSPAEIVKFMLCGLNVIDFKPEITDMTLLTDHASQIVKPSPNLYFMRDPAFTLGDSIVISRMYWPIRKREPKIIKTIIENHSYMKYAKPNMIDRHLGSEVQLFTTEGGDVMALGEGEYVITDSERTSKQGVGLIAKELLEHRGAKKVYQPIIPAKRAFIHLDTVCSLAGPDHVVVHPKAVSANSETMCWTSESIKNSEDPFSVKKDFIKVLEEDYGKKIIETAGGGARANLEQFDDATNVFMVNPEVAVTYDRNRETNRIMNDQGIKTAEFSGSDLVMGRGGARCMTMPIRRD